MVILSHLSSCQPEVDLYAGADVKCTKVDKRDLLSSGCVDQDRTGRCLGHKLLWLEIVKIIGNENKIITTIITTIIIVLVAKSHLMSVMPVLVHVLLPPSIRGNFSHSGNLQDLDYDCGGGGDGDGGGGGGVDELNFEWEKCHPFNNVNPPLTPSLLNT